MQMQQKEGLAQQNLVGTLKSNKSFSTFINAIDKAGRTASLAGTEQETLFAFREGATDGLAMGGGLSFALTNIRLRKMSDVAPPARILAMFAGGAIAASVAGLVVMSFGLIAAPPLPRADWALVAFGLSLGFLASNVALQYGASRVNAHTAALIMLSEVVFAAVSSVLLGAAEMNTRTWIGGSLILAAAAWSALSPSTPKAH